MATIRNRNGRWQVQVRRSGARSLNRTFTLKNDALIWAREQERIIELEGCVHNDRTKLLHSVSDLIERYKIEIAPTKKSYHIEKHYLAMLQQLPFAQVPLKQLSTDALQRWVDEHKLKHKPSYTVRIIGILNRVFNIAIKHWGYPLHHNPIEKVIKPTQPRQPIRRLGPTVLQKFENPKSRLAWIVVFALETAMRRSEIACLKWTDVDIEKRLAHIRQTKNGYSRYIPLSQLAIAAIQNGNAEAETVFGMSSNAIRLAWDRFKKQNHIHGVRFHDLRHEAISRLFEKGLSVPEVAMISGHRTISQLFRYAHGDMNNIIYKINNQ